MNRKMYASLLTLLVVSAMTAGNALAQPPGGPGGPGGTIRFDVRVMENRAQPPGGPGGPGGRFGGRGGMMGGGAMMLRLPEVQKELKMTPEQLTKLENKQQEMRDAMRNAFQNADGQDPEARQKMFADMQAQQKKMVEEVLTPEQTKRFRQLELQQQGPAAILFNAEVATELKVTDEQKSKMQGVQQQSMQEMRDMMQGQDVRSMTQEERQTFMTKMQGMRKANEEKLLGVLTAEQKKQWTEMTGVPFKFPAMQGLGGRGGFGGQGGRGQGGRGQGGGRRQGGNSPSGT
ncbi:MAG: hypothetical protein SFU56_02440 [Capsulimonadales bacterium]|nr:hypothetical protein [Capsulimonadales bacterium]